MTIWPHVSSVAHAIIVSPPRTPTKDILVACGFLLGAVLARLAIDWVFPDKLAYITFFPALVLTAILCRLRATILFMLGAAVIGSFWIDLSDHPRILFQVLGMSLFLVAASIIVLLTESVKGAYRLIDAHDRQLHSVNNELAHRMRNLLQVATAIVSQSIRTSGDKEDLRSTLTGRLGALGQAQTLLTLNTADVEISKLLDVAVAPLAPGKDRVIVEGSKVLLPPEKVTTLSLVLYELATNALKHGAWSDAHGIVKLRWTSSNGTFTLAWEEHHGPAVTGSERIGTGSKLIKTAIADAVVDYRLQPDGARFRIDFPLSQDKPRRDRYWAGDGFVGEPVSRLPAGRAEWGAVSRAPHSD
jgi:two-component sensor histidine kinase